ncbi:MAG: hypothetical protein GC138_01310 [Gammaproteobacteria bacterium]|nr:hypothetical protein [Gammaproteobacteria bacterium]
MNKYAGASIRGVFLLAVMTGLTACGGSGVDTVNALTSLGNTGTVTNNGSSGSGSGSGSTAVASVNLSWIAPSTRLDNTAILPSDIGGYHVYYGTAQTNLQLMTDIGDASVTTFDTPALSSGTYYFAVAAYDSNGVEGRLSNIAQKVI